MQRIYLDNAATTPLIPEVVQAMHAWNQQFFGNPSSVHHHGQIVRARVEEARDVIAEFMDIPSKQLFFTSGATEANNWILKSFAQQFPDKQILVSQLEHPSVFKTAQYLQARGYLVDFIEPDVRGQITVEQIEKRLTPKTALISVMFVNNETGILNPVKEIGAFCAAHGIRFHCDAVQAFGKIPFSVPDLQIDYLTISAHKVHGPKGLGAVFIREPALLEPLLHGGEQEAGRRAGTENVTGIIGFAQAVQWLKTQSDALKKVQELQNFFEKEIVALFKQAVVIGQNVERSPFISQIAFPGKDNQNVMMLLDLNGLSVSVGSACSSGSVKPSRILQKMNLPDSIVNSALRFSFSHLTQKNDLEHALQVIKSVLF